MKKAILLALLITIGILGVDQAVLAESENAVLSISPSEINQPVGHNFNLSIQIDPIKDTVCVIKGSLVFENLTCKSISLEAGVKAQTVPTCSDPDFTIGIPHCATLAQNIFSLSVAGDRVGKASVSFVGAKVIGIGVDVVSEIKGGDYNIIAAAGGGGTGTVPTPLPENPQENIPSENPEPSENVQNPEISVNTPKGILDNLSNFYLNSGLAGLLSAVKNILSSGAGKVWLAIVTVILVLLLIALLIRWILSKRDSKKE